MQTLLPRKRFLATRTQDCKLSLIIQYVFRDGYSADTELCGYSARLLRWAAPEWVKLKYLFKHGWTVAIGSTNTYSYRLYGRGLQCFKLNGNHTENDRYWQKNNFVLFAKFLKMYSFFRICILRLQKVLLWPKKFFSWKISIWVPKKRRILCWFQIRWCRPKQMPLKKASAKKLCEFWVFSFLCIFRCFLLLTFVRVISESWHQRIWNQHKILCFFDTHIDIFQEKNFLGHNSTFCNLKMQMRKKRYIFKHFVNSKKLFFCQYLSFSVWFLLKFQKSIKLKPLLYGSRCTQLPLIEKLLQWLSGPFPSLSATTDRPRDTGPDSNDVRTHSIYSTISVDDINAKAVEAWKQKGSV